MSTFDPQVSLPRHRRIGHAFTTVSRQLAKVMGVITAKSKHGWRSGGRAKTGGSPFKGARYASGPEKVRAWSRSRQARLAG